MLPKLFLDIRQDCHNIEALCARFSFKSPEYQTQLSAMLSAALSEPQRHYHDSLHILNLAAYIDACAPLIHDPQVMLLAALFHDAVYAPERNDNEAQSSMLAAHFLQNINITPAQIQAVRAIIDATHRHEVIDMPPYTDDLRLFLDLDLGILAAPVLTYQEYAEQIRREYAIYPDDLYREGRKAVLRRLLERPRLYVSAFTPESWEWQARQNLAREIESLS